MVKKIKVVMFVKGRKRHHMAHQILINTKLSWEIMQKIQ